MDQLAHVLQEIISDHHHNHHNHNHNHHHHQHQQQQHNNRSGLPRHTDALPSSSSNSSSSSSLKRGRAPRPETTTDRTNNHRMMMMEHERIMMGGGGPRPRMMGPNGRAVFDRDPLMAMGSTYPIDHHIHQHQHHRSGSNNNSRMDPAAHPPFSEPHRRRMTAPMLLDMGGPIGSMHLPHPHMGDDHHLLNMNNGPIGMSQRG